MQTFKTIHDLRNYLDDLRANGKSIGFVPTMGALHEGHLSLIREAKEENDVVVCSIFVNPIQFNNSSDLEKYPRTIETDMQLLIQEDCDVLFFPDEKEMYPVPSTEQYDFGDLDKVMEGEHRPGHFNGVAVVVKKLFEIVEPQRAYFGLKDYQQMVIVHKLTKDYNMPVEIVPCSIVREENGLAMSSRNERLSVTERTQAALIYQTLKMVKIKSGFATITEVKEFVEKQFRKQKNMKLEYFEIVDMYSLQPLRTWAQSTTVIACIAVWVGNVRLIDNIILFS
ncbi:MAG TPA: pantoate--beta-alanine ligase [Bacteroidales bacterium]|nr:pantoate--beta-alanine ligase [Bacteroidales bacterium]